jgi:glutaredoxin
MVKIYSIPQCPYCTDLKNKLTEAEIEFEDVNVLLPEHSEEYKKVAEKTQSDEVPIVRVGKQLLVPNVSFKNINEAFDLTKKFLV